MSKIQLFWCLTLKQEVKSCCNWILQEFPCPCQLEASKKHHWHVTSWDSTHLFKDLMNRKKCNPTIITIRESKFIKLSVRNKVKKIIILLSVYHFPRYIINIWVPLHIILSLIYKCLEEFISKWILKIIWKSYFKIKMYT